MPRRLDRHGFEPDDLYDYPIDAPPVRAKAVRPPPRQPPEAPVVDLPDEPADADEHGLIFNGTRQERQYVTAALGEFYDDHWFRQILYKVKGGKEANVYCCRAEPEVAAATGLSLIAAKVYRPRMFRAMHNDWFYKQGRTARDPEGKAVYSGKDLRAARRDTRVGQKIDMASWCRWEYDTLARLHAAGVAVPRPLAHGQSAILMEYLGDESSAAPVLHSVSMNPALARQTHSALLRDVERALACSRIHADLSAHNVMWWQNRAVLIDWPQAVDAQTHPEASSLLERDLERLCRYAERQGVSFEGRDAPAEAERLSSGMWRRLSRGEL